MASASASTSTPTDLKPTAKSTKKKVDAQPVQPLAKVTAGMKRAIELSVEEEEICAKVLAQSEDIVIGHTSWCDECTDQVEEQGEDGDSDSKSDSSDEDVDAPLKDKFPGRKWGKGLGDQAERLMMHAVEEAKACMQFKEGIAFDVPVLNNLVENTGSYGPSHNWESNNKKTASGLFCVDGKPFTISADSCRDLIAAKHADPSPFGDLKSATTRVDADVRHAFEVPASRLTLSTPLRAYLKYGVEKSAGLKHLFGVHVEAKLYKLNIYPEGGHFRAHQDTPRQDTIGTLLMEFNEARLEGGHLRFPFTPASEKKVKTDSTATAHSSTTSSAAEHWIATPTGMIVSVAFYGNVIHAVSPVKSGYRVSLAFHLVPAMEERDAAESGDDEDEPYKPKTNGDNKGDKKELEAKILRTLYASKHEDLCFLMRLADDKKRHGPEDAKAVTRACCVTLAAGLWRGPTKNNHRPLPAKSKKKGEAKKAIAADIAAKPEDSDAEASEPDDAHRGDVEEGAASPGDIKSQFKATALLDRYLKASNAEEVAKQLRALLDKRPREVLAMIMNSKYALDEMKSIPKGFVKSVDGPSLALLAMIPNTLMFFLPVKLRGQHQLIGECQDEATRFHTVAYQESKYRDEYKLLLEYMGKYIDFGQFYGLGEVQRIHDEGALSTGNEMRAEGVDNLYLATACVVVDKNKYESFLEAKTALAAAKTQSKKKKQKTEPEKTKKDTGKVGGFPVPAAGGGVEHTDG
jgi:hypothetical protein